MEKIKAIRTEYKGIWFRSKLEAQWAKFFDENHIEWIYEPEGIVFEDGTCYLPDFYLPNGGIYFEVKGVMSEKDEDKIIRLSKNGDVIVGYSNGDMDYYTDQIKNIQNYIRLLFTKKDDKISGFFSFSSHDVEVNLSYLDDFDMYFSKKDCLYCIKNDIIPGYFSERINKLFYKKWNKESYIDVVKK